MRFPIRFSRASAVLLGLLGMGGRNSYADVGQDAVHVRMGWAFRATVPRSTVTTVSSPGRVGWGWGIGVHGWRGRWVVNGSLKGIVRLEIEPRARGRVLGVPVRLRDLWISLQDPEGFLHAIGR